jgi:hypothetical protein
MFDIFNILTVFFQYLAVFEIDVGVADAADKEALRNKNRVDFCTNL